MPATARKQRALTSSKVDPTKPASIIINDRFNGLTHFCRLTGYPVSTAHGWTISGHIPPRWKGESTQPHILAVAAANKIKMAPLDFVEQGQSNSRGPNPRSRDSAAAAPPPEDLPPRAAAARPIASSDA